MSGRTNVVLRQVFRRTVLKGTAASFACIGLGTAARSSPADVAVIGAGAAGMAATETLLSRGKSVVCIEAMGRTGGGVHTDTKTFGVPFDIGAHWLHNANKNSFADYGRKNGFTIYDEPGDEILYIGRRGRDVAPAEVIPDVGDWADTVHLQAGSYSMGKDFGSFSCLDWYNADEAPNMFCREGFGTLVAHRWRQVPVELNAAARTIRWDGPGIDVETDKAERRLSTSR